MDYITIACIIGIIIIQLVAFFIKKQYKTSLHTNFEPVIDAKLSDEYLTYYKQMQMTDIHRTIGTIVLILVMIWHTDSSAFQLFAIAVGAIILVFQTLILSFVIHLMLISNYKVGETVKVWSLGEWEIIYIKELYFGLAGRTKSGEHTGEFFLIPNNKVRENPIIKVDYSPNAHQKISCSVYYIPEKTTLSLDEYIWRLTDFLDELLPLRNAKGVWHYKSYIWYRYKIEYDLHSDQTVEIIIGFVARQSKSNDVKRQIYHFVQEMSEVVPL